MGARKGHCPHSGGCLLWQVFLDGEAALLEEERKEERAAREFRRFNHRHPSPPFTAAAGLVLICMQTQNSAGLARESYGCGACIVQNSGCMQQMQRCSGGQSMLPCMHARAGGATAARSGTRAGSTCSGTASARRRCCLSATPGSCPPGTPTRASCTRVRRAAPP